MSSASLHVGNLHPDCTEAMLFRKFWGFGKILNIHICKDRHTNKSLGFGYINFYKKAEAETALTAMNYDVINGQSIRIMWANNNTKDFFESKASANLYVKNLDPAIDEKVLFDLFAAFGDVLSLKVTKDENGMSMGYGFVQFDNEDSARKAIEEMDGKLLRGKVIYVRKCASKANLDVAFKNVYLKHLHPSVEDEDLKSLCERFGKIVSVKVMRDEDGLSKGFGFVSFCESDSAKEAVDQLNGSYFKDRPLFAGRAKKKAERKAEIHQQLMKKLRCDT